MLHLKEVDPIISAPQKSCIHRFWNSREALLYWPWVTILRENIWYWVSSAPFVYHLHFHVSELPVIVALEEVSIVVQHKRCVNIIWETPVVSYSKKNISKICPFYPSALPLWISLSFCYSLVGETPILKTDNYQNFMNNRSPCHPGRHKYSHQQFWRLCQRKGQNINFSLF